MNQIVIGAALPYLISACFYVARRGRASMALLITAPLTMAVCAIWAVIPDIPRGLGMTGLYHRLAGDPRINIFFFHYWIDQHETDSILYTAAFVLMAVSLFVVAWREVWLREQEKGVQP